MKNRMWLGYLDRTYNETLHAINDAHAIICGPTRSGKGSTFLLQQMFTNRSSCLVVDPKAQMAAISARYRRDVLKQKVFILNPFEILPGCLGGFTQAQFNPLSSLDPDGDEFGAQADALAEALLPMTETHDPYWIKSARILVSGVAMALRALYKNMTLLDVYRIIAGPDLFSFCEEVVKSEPEGFIVERLAKMTTPFAKESKEISGIVNSAITDLSWIGNNLIAKSVSGTTFDWADMTKEPMTVYLTLPGKNQVTFSAWSRMAVNAAVHANMYEGQKDQPLLLVLDEFKTSVGNLGIIETLQTLGAGYGIQILSSFCDLTSLRGLFPHSWETFLGSAGVAIFHGPRLDPFTSTFLSNLSGTIDVPNVSHSAHDNTQPLQFGGGVTGLINSSINALAGNRNQLNIGQTHRAALLPEHVRELGDDEFLAWGAGLKGYIRGGRRPYWEDPNFAGMYDPDPYHTKSKTRKP